MGQSPHTPLLVKGKDSEGEEVEIDVALLLASDQNVRETFARGLQELLDKGFPASYSISVGLILSAVFDDGEAVVVFPKHHLETHLPDYITDAAYIHPDAREPV